MLEETDVTDSSTEDVTDSSTEEGQGSNGVDYKTKYENSLRALREERAKSKMRGTVDPSEIEKLIEKKVQSVTKARIQEDIEAEVAKMAQTEDERKDIMEVYKNRINPSGFSMTAIARDLEDARILALRGRNTGKDKEKIKAAIAEENAMRSLSGNAAPVGDEGEESTYSAEERKFLTDFTGIKH